MRGHEIVVLTSTHGLGIERRDGQMERRLILNGFSIIRLLRDSVCEMKPIELQNNQALLESIESFQPETSTLSAYPSL